MREGSPLTPTPFEDYLRELSAVGRHMLVLPTTTRELALLEQLGLRPDVDAIVGRNEHALAPAELLTRIEDKAPAPDARVLVFSDQLVSAVDAPLLVRRDGVARYVSSLEYILNAQYGYALLAINGDRLSRLPAGAPAVDVLGLLVDHLEANERLGSNWLVRELQTQRLPQDRRLQQRRRIRALRSSILHMIGRARKTWSADHDRTLQTLDDLYRNR